MSALQRHPVAGVLRLGLRRTGTRTVLYDCYARTPLRVLRPIYLDDTGMAYLYILNPCGGVVSGDTYTLHITLNPGAQAYVTTPSATQLYATLRTPAEQHIDFTLNPGTVLACSRKSQSVPGLRVKSMCCSAGVRGLRRVAWPKAW